jgi:hypothetical protein
MAMSFPKEKVVFIWWYGILFLLYIFRIQTIIVAHMIDVLVSMLPPSKRDKKPRTSVSSVFRAADCHTENILNSFFHFIWLTTALVKVLLAASFIPFRRVGEGENATCIF